MRNKRIDEFRIAHVFGAIAVLVALYGIWLAAAAWLDRPSHEARAGQGASFWTAPASGNGSSLLRRAADAPGARSFWEPRTPDPLIEAPRLAGDFFGIREQL